ncbi:DNA-binding transcriptional regulator, CsgD family [Devosia sp. YR412]|uniref:helix-turn-helix transcriptional regulator n=1 Tax=Devosia sp. YR412 TaxID=1881030 RepID=UPI0008C60CD0|nr:helix-turn-helix transcriptional regulator [Devosia sp. YR412]SEP85802.1 DNA-binding transcriptional regulator, CsgD family [Devosia sp. YR412]
MDTILGLIDDIYEAAAHPEHWPAALKNLADSTGSIDATMGGQTAAQVPLLVTVRTDPVMVRSYAEHYHRRNAMQLALHTTPVGRPVVDAMVVDAESFRASEFYNEWCVPQNYLHGAALNLATSQGWRATLMVSGRNEYDQDALKLFGAVTPHLIRAFQLNQVLHETRSLGMGAFAALEYLDRGALLVGANGIIRTANGMADLIMAAGDGLTLKDGRLSCADPRETAQLSRLIAQTVRGMVSRDEGILQISRSEGRSPLSVQCLPFPTSNWWPGFTQQLAMIFVTDPDARMEQTVERMRQRYGLTPAEARLAWEIVRGGGRKSAADKRGISVATARSQLTSIFDKTGVRRQSELVRLLLDD